MQFDVVQFEITTIVWAVAVSAVVIALVAGASAAWWMLVRKRGRGGSV
jgi:hypothetical protein